MPRYIIIVISCIVGLGLNLIHDATWWETLSVIISSFFFLDLISKFGNKIVLLEFMAFYGAFTWLLMPMIAYEMFPAEHPLARLWVKFMEISAVDYFSYIIPGLISMRFGFGFPLKSPTAASNPIVFIKNLRIFLKGKQYIGWCLIAIGGGFSALGLTVESTWGNVFFLFSSLFYVGILYLYFSDFPYKWLPIGLLIASEGLRSIQTGMFGGSIFLLVLIMIVLSIEWKLKLWTKAIFTGLAFFGIIIIQSIKGEYRATTWDDKEKANVDVFGSLVSQQINNSTALVDESKLFFLVLRFNNGWQIARTMDRVPSRHAFANGESIFNSLAAAAVPRFLWPDKPKTGGKANLERFWGESYGRTSMNISPIGEAYANFGRFGGIIYMFFFGLFLNWLIVKVLFWVDRKPTILCWFPVIFFSFFGVETDLLSIFNAFAKGVIFAILFTKAFQYATGRRL